MINKKISLTLDKNRTLMVNKIHCFDEPVFRKKIKTILNANNRLCAFFAIPLHKKKEQYQMVAVIADDTKGSIKTLSFQTENKSFHSFTPKIPQFHLYEREIYEQSGLLPIGHPWLKPVRFPIDSHFPTENNNIGEIDFYQMESHDVHQVAVGPVHAGIIEPGHFRFQCYGENVYHLEISLGYQHRGIEKRLINGPHNSTLYQMEVLSGDTTVGHATAYCNIIEQLANIKLSENSTIIRVIALELERCANHIGDLGALAGDAGYLPTMSYCGRIRGDFLNMTGIICGNRFGRSLLTPGGVKQDLPGKQICELRKNIEKGKEDFKNATALLWTTPSLLARFEDTGSVSLEDAKNIGLVGVAAKASGLPIDSRITHPSGIYKKLKIESHIAETGDVFARARVRWHEVIESIDIIKKLLDDIENPPDRQVKEEIELSIPKLMPNTMAVSLVEGWRGEICHVAITDSKGKFSKYKIIDPSFHNWFGLTLALRGEQISDFPLCNKSFNLSYCGFDL